MRPTLALGALTVLAGGCAGAVGAAAPGAHVLFLLRPGCSTVVARTLTLGEARAFTVIELEDADYAPRAGDVLEGPPREGRSVFVYYPEEAHGTRQGGWTMTVDVQAVGLEVGEARAHLDAACGPPPPP